MGIAQSRWQPTWQKHYQASLSLEASSHHRRQGRCCGSFQAKLVVTSKADPADSNPPGNEERQLTAASPPALAWVLRRSLQPIYDNMSGWPRSWIGGENRQNVSSDWQKVWGKKEKMFRQTNDSMMVWWKPGLQVKYFILISWVLGLTSEPFCSGFQEALTTHWHLPFNLFPHR